MDKAAPPQPYRPGRAVLQGLLDLRPSLGVDRAAASVEDAVARGLAVAQVLASVLHGFVNNGGTFSNVDFPGASGRGTQVMGVNDAGQMVATTSTPPASSMDS